jgi:RNA polymerase sigma-70 factor (ECF subfamily)
VAATEAPDIAQVVAEHGGMIRRIVATVEANPAIAQELEQEILVALWRALPTWRGASSLRTFVARVAEYRAVTHVTREARRPRSVEIDDALASDAPEPSAEVETQDARAKLAAALRALPDGLRAVAALTLEGLTPAEIAEALGITANACSIRLHRAKAILAGAMGEGGAG